MNELTDKEKERKRFKNVWYGRWIELARMLKKRNSNEKIMRVFYSIVNDIDGHHYARIAYSSYQDLLLVFEDCLNKDCDECERRFTCFTEE